MDKPAKLGQNLLTMESSATKYLTIKLLKERSAKTVHKTHQWDSHANLTNSIKTNCHNLLHNLYHIDVPELA